MPWPPKPSGVQRSRWTVLPAPLTRRVMLLMADRTQPKGAIHPTRRPLATNHSFGTLELLTGPQDLGDLPSSAAHPRQAWLHLHRTGGPARAGSSPLPAPCPLSGIRAAKASTFCCQPSSSGPLSPVTSTLSSATLTSPAPCKSSFTIGRTRCHLASSSSVGICPVFLSGCGAISVVRMAYLVPAGRRSFLRNRRMPPMGLPMRPGELNRYRSAVGSRSGRAARMCWTLTVTPLAAICLVNSSATIAPLPNLEAWKYSILIACSLLGSPARGRERLPGHASASTKPRHRRSRTPLRGGLR